MADNYLITGYCGKNHVTAENDRGINAGIFGVGRYVLPVGKQFKAEYIGANTVRIYDGKLVDNGAAAGIPAGEYIDLVIPNASQGMNRNDLIVFQYTQDSSTLIETGSFSVVLGVETSGTAVDPELQQEDLLTGRATFDQMALWRVPVSTGTISAPVQLFEVSKSLDKAGSGSVVVDAVSSDGVSYTATVEDLEELYNGFELTIIPNIASTTTAPTLNVNGLGAKPIRLSLSLNNSMLVQPKENGYYAAGRPVKMMFDSKYLTTGAWRVSNKQRPSAEDLYGTTPIESGGTGADNAADAILNLGIYPVGSIYMSVVDVSPTTLFGGTWERIEDTFLLAAGEKYKAGSTGGEATHTLTEEEMPSHKHGMKVPSVQEMKLSTDGSTRYYPILMDIEEDNNGIINNSGGGKAHNNMPPYLVVYVWKRTA